MSGCFSWPLRFLALAPSKMEVVLVDTTSTAGDVHVQRMERVAASAPAGAACEEQRLQFARQLGGAVFDMACKEADISYIGEKTEKDKKTEKGEPKKKKAKVVQSEAGTSTSRESSVESLL